MFFGLPVGAAVVGTVLDGWFWGIAFGLAALWYLLAIQWEDRHGEWN